MYLNDEEIQNLSKSVHRTWLELLLVNDHRALAAIVLDSDVLLHQESIYPDWNSEWELVGAHVDIPARSYSVVSSDDLVRKLLSDTLRTVLNGYVERPQETMSIMFRIKLKEPEEDWYNVVQHAISEMSNPNQGLVTEKVFKRNSREPIIYNEMKFGSQSEIRIAQEFENRSTLFFPLPLAVRHETGQFYKDHREVDFLICEGGIWGILEVAHHANRYEQDAEKATWFKKSGILCVEFYTAERCFKDPAAVVDEFLAILRQHRGR